MAFATQVRVVFTEDCEKGINQQINNELYGFYVYQSMASWCGRDDVALHGLRNFCLKSAAEELDDARGLIDYMSRKGGLVNYLDIPSPYKALGISGFQSAYEVMDQILNLEKRNYQSLLTLHKCANACKDAEMEEFIQTHYLKPQVKTIKEVADLLTNLKRVGNDGVGLFIWDRKLDEGTGQMGPFLHKNSFVREVLPNPFKC